MTKKSVNFPSCSCDKVYEEETGFRLKVRLKEHRKAVCRGEVEKTSKNDHKWELNGHSLLLQNEVKVKDKEHSRIRRLKEPAHMLGYNEEIKYRDKYIMGTHNQKGSRENKIAIWAKVKKSYIIIMSTISWVDGNNTFIIPQNSVWIVQQNTLRNG